jgi:hypothetical protein
MCEEETKETVLYKTRTEIVTAKRTARLEERKVKEADCSVESETASREPRFTRELPFSTSLPGACTMPRRTVSTSLEASTSETPAYRFLVGRFAPHDRTAGTW